jgi:uncharacterized protein
MSLEENKIVAQRFLLALCAGDSDTLGSLMADDGTYWTVGSIAVSGTMDKPAVMAKVARLPSDIPTGVKMTFGDITAEDDRVCVEARSFADVAPGKLYRNSYHFIFQIENRKIKLVKEYMDTEHLAKIFLS